jgi:uncharacterized protein with von Willebrand factor type A (vWA) domain
MSDSAVASSVEDMAVAFARILRGVGISAPVDSVATFVQALDRLGVGHRESVYWAGRSTLVRRPEDFDIFDRAFAVFWDQRLVNTVEEIVDSVRIAIATDAENDESDGNGDGTGNDDADLTLTLRFSAAEALREKDFADYSDDELQLARELMGRLRLAGPRRRSLRLRCARHANHVPDLRRTVRASLRSGGEPLRRYWKEPDDKLRRLVLLLDISGSMEPYSRAFLNFVHSAVAGRRRVEAFTFGTRLTRLTKELSTRDPDQALDRAARQVSDWSGGTRLGECLREFNDAWGVRGLARGAIVVILSDGWDRGQPELLSAQMERLHRASFRTIWVNPLKVTPGYAPLAKGMAAALPHVDEFVEGHSIAALDKLCVAISRLDDSPYTSRRHA